MRVPLLALTFDRAVRDALEVAIVVAVGAMLWGAVARIRAGAIKPLVCPACGRPTARAYPRCKHCDAAL